MTVKFDSHETTTDVSTNIYGANWSAQSFKTTTLYTIYAVYLYLGRTLAPGNLTVSIRSSRTGSDLCVGTVAANWVSAGWKEIDFTTPRILGAGLTYNIVVRALTGDASNYVTWSGVDGGTSYTDGIEYLSSDSGASWDAWATDYLFQTWGLAAKGNWK